MGLRKSWQQAEDDDQPWLTLGSHVRLLPPRPRHCFPDRLAENLDYAVDLLGAYDQGRRQQVAVAAVSTDQAAVAAGGSQTPADVERNVERPVLLFVLHEFNCPD